MLTDQPLPFYISGMLVGSVQHVTPHAGFHRGSLVLDADRSINVTLFEAAVALARQIDVASPDDYLAAWNTWRSACNQIRDLGVRIGYAEGPVMEFSIESDWSIEWEILLPIDFSTNQ